MDPNDKLVLLVENNQLSAKVERLQAEVTRLQQTCDEFRSASLLIGDAGDAEGVQPHHVESHISELRATIDKLPKCWGLNEAGELVQDVSVVPGMRVWRIGHVTTLGETVNHIDETGAWLRWKGVMYKGSELGSTQAAATAAREANAND